MIMPVEDEHASMPGMSMEEHHEIALMTVSEQELVAGATLEVDHTFASVPEEQMEIVCRLPGHLEAGMRTPVTFK
jgi:uncharacterized cupredoxin-like copper-binding protein